MRWAELGRGWMAAAARRLAGWLEPPEEPAVEPEIEARQEDEESELEPPSDWLALAVPPPPGHWLARVRAAGVSFTETPAPARAVRKAPVVVAAPQRAERTATPPLPAWPRRAPRTLPVDRPWPNRPQQAAAVPLAWPKRTPDLVRPTARKEVRRNIAAPQPPVQRSRSPGVVELSVPPARERQKSAPPSPEYAPARATTVEFEEPRPPLPRAWPPLPPEPAPLDDLRSTLAERDRVERLEREQRGM